MKIINTSAELYHHGIKGQKWGVRRYQLEDGTLTEEGKKRRISDPMPVTAVTVNRHNGKVMQTETYKSNTRYIEAQGQKNRYAPYGSTALNAQRYRAAVKNREALRAQAQTDPANKAYQTALKYASEIVDEYPLEIRNPEEFKKQQELAERVQRNKEYLDELEANTQKNQFPQNTQQAATQGKAKTQSAVQKVGNKVVSAAASAYKAVASFVSKVIKSIGSLFGKRK